MARSVVITGGTGGLGAAVTRAFVEDGWDVVVPWVAPHELERVERHDRLRLVEADLMEPGAAGYVTGKAAVLALVDVLHAEYAGDGVRTNAILPSVIDTPANRASMPDADFDTWVKPEEIARVVRFLCSDDAAVTSGGRNPPPRKGGG